MTENWHQGLTEKQRRFCEAYSSNGGNALQAATAAGYKQPHPTGQRQLQKATIVKALELLRSDTTNAAIADRTERQSTWTEIMRDPNEETKDRLKASELLGRSQGDFTEKRDDKLEIVVRRTPAEHQIDN